MYIHAINKQCRGKLKFFKISIELLEYSLNNNHRIVTLSLTYIISIKKYNFKNRLELEL